MNAIVIGAGVAGLAAACTLHEAGIAVTVLEAHDAVGGRVRSLRDAGGRHLGDLGPSWVWPRHQPYLAAWLDRLGIDTVAQFDAGDACIERAPGRPVERASLPGRDGRRRPAGGPQAIVDALLARLPPGSVRTGAAVDEVRGTGTTLEVVTADGERHAADRLVIAVPPRVAVRDIAFDPPLPASLARALEGAPTWMAAQAKALVVYPEAFWRARGLSGRIASAVGPLAEAHDHCGVDGAPAALTGFIGIDPRGRETLASELGEAALGRAVVEQLVRCFGPDAAAPAHVRVEDWARDRRIATALDIERPGGHPSVLSSIVREAWLDGRVRFAAAETAEVSPGLLEGALVAGERAAIGSLD